MADLGKLGGNTKTFSGDQDRKASVTEDVFTESIHDTLQDILQELKLQTELLKGILQ